MFNGHYFGVPRAAVVDRFDFRSLDPIQLKEI